MASEETLRIAEIRKRLEEYRKHKNDPHSYFEEEIDAVREMKLHATEDLEFLLKLYDQKKQWSEFVSDQS